MFEIPEYVTLARQMNVAIRVRPCRAAWLGILLTNSSGTMSNRMNSRQQ